MDNKQYNVISANVSMKISQGDTTVTVAMEIVFIRFVLVKSNCIRTSTCYKNQVSHFLFPPILQAGEAASFEVTFEQRSE